MNLGFTEATIKMVPPVDLGRKIQEEDRWNRGFTPLIHWTAELARQAIGEYLAGLKEAFLI